MCKIAAVFIAFKSKNDQNTKDRVRDTTAKVKVRCSNNCMMVTQDALVGRMTNSLISWARLQRGWEGGRSGMGTWALQSRIGRGIVSSESLQLKHEARRAKRVLNASTYNPGSCVPITKCTGQ